MHALEMDSGLGNYRVNRPDHGYRAGGACAAVEFDPDDLQGAVIRRDNDTQKEVPISNAQITATRGSTTITTRSDA